VTAQNPPAKPDPFLEQLFENKVRPLLHRACVPCHGPQQQKGGRRLDNLLDSLRKGAHGSAIVPGDPDNSGLIKAIRYDGELKMPPGGKLSAEEIETLTDWVKAGAIWPGSKVSEAAKKAAISGDYIITDEQRKFWSFQPVKKVAPPKVTNAKWVANPVDSFVLAKLEKAGLQPSPKADRRTLIRRAYISLIGLPPSIEEVEAFEKDKSPDAWTKVVDQLLASPQYGERWARRWMDIARYADTKGYLFTEDRSYTYAYTYRDWLIRAFNNDMPYDQFVIQQLAGDKVSTEDDRSSLAAMGYLTLGRRFLGNMHDIIDDRIDVTMRGFQGMTVACARCHDHKYDPISAKDYYALYGVFASSTEPNPLMPISSKAVSAPYDAWVAKTQALEKDRQNAIRTQMRALRDKVQANPDAYPKAVRDTLQNIRLNVLPDDRQFGLLSPHFAEQDKKQIDELKRQLEEVKKQSPPKPELAHSMVDLPNPVQPAVFLRGNPGNRGPSVPRRYLAILSADEPKPFTDGSGRLELAKTIASKDNPLTARVIVNRIWASHFLNGLVRTPSDFGVRGAPPSHPELLDYLASTLMEEGWSLKKLHRRILLSNTYQQASAYNPVAAAKDPMNNLLWSFNRQRYDLETQRDALLAAAGKLDKTMFGPSVDILRSPYSTRRTVYAFIERQNLPGFFRTFDLASPDASSPQRFRTTVPQQALYMLNSPFVMDMAKILGEDAEKQPDGAARVTWLYRRLFERNPTPQETAMGLKFVANATNANVTNTRIGGFQTVSLETPKPEGEQKTLGTWARYAHALLMTNEFCFVD
jgi:hypothetical protein